MNAHPTFIRQSASVERWLIGRVAFYLECDADQIDPTVALAETGIDSASAVGLCGDVEDYFQIDADPTLVFDYPTVGEIAQFILRELADGEQAA